MPSNSTRNNSSQTSSDEIQCVTLNYYESNAESFWQGTRDHDVSQNIRAFLQAMPSDRVLDVLDFGCSPGRDLAKFKQLGHRATGLDGSVSFCTMAHEYSGCPVLNQQFMGLDLEAGSFDGIYANASMFHIPSQEFHQVLMCAYYR